MYYIPNYKESRQFCENEQFYFTTHYLDGFRIDLFNYNDFKVWYEEFLPNKKEMRGLAFVFNENVKEGVDYSVEFLNENVFNTYIALEKFWNVNQVPETQLDKLKDLKITSIYEKVDGSIVTFVMLPNGKIYTKSKMSFKSEQAVLAHEIFLNNKSINTFVTYCLQNNLSPVFEYVSSSNQVVLHYSTEDIILLRVRNNTTGEYLNLTEFNTDGITKSIDYTSKYKNLDELIVAMETLENIEGFVVQFNHNYHVKFKTKWYFQHHKLYTNSLNFNNLLIELILDNKIDDVISQIQLDEFKLIQIKEVRTKLNKYTDDLIEFFNTIQFNNNYKELAITYKKHKYFSLIMSVFRKSNNLQDKEVVITEIHSYIKNETKYFQKANEFLNSIN